VPKLKQTPLEQPSDSALAAGERMVKPITAATRADARMFIGVSLSLVNALIRYFLVVGRSGKVQFPPNIIETASSAHAIEWGLIPQAALESFRLKWKHAPSPNPLPQGGARAFRGIPSPLREKERCCCSLSLGERVGVRGVYFAVSLIW
jgi:hypothetical protein